MSNPVKVRISRKEVVPGGLMGVEPKIRRGALDGLSAVGLAMLATAKRRIQRGPKSGVLYRKANPNRQHQSSAPGQSPATDTGGLVNSGFHEVDEGAMEVSIGFAKFYAVFLEYGTRLMAKRPFLLPTVEEWRSKIAGVIRKAIQARLSE